MTVDEFSEIVEIEKLIVSCVPCESCKGVRKKILEKVTAMLAKNSMRRE